MHKSSVPVVSVLLVISLLSGCGGGGGTGSNTQTISGVDVSARDTEVDIAFTTSSPGKAVIYYGLDGSGSYTLSETESISTATHRITLSRLTASASYVYKIVCDSASFEGKVSTSELRTISGLSITPTTTSVVFTFTTTNPEKAGVQVTKVPDGNGVTIPEASAYDATYTTEHSIQMINLSPGTRYYYVIWGASTSNPDSSYAEGEFSTLSGS